MKKKIARDAIGKPFCRLQSPCPWRWLIIICPQTESDSDTEILAPTNRGNKLKQNAKFVREGKLGPPTGPAVYKQARFLRGSNTLEIDFDFGGFEIVLTCLSRTLSMPDTDAP